MSRPMPCTSDQEPQVGSSVYCCGTSLFGQTGHHPETSEGNINFFAKVPNLPKNIVSIVASSSHCLALTDKGKVYSWGDNQCGQCGTHPCNKEGIIIKSHCVDLEERCIAVAVGDSHSLALSLEGNLYFFGSYRNHNGEHEQDIPTDIHDPRYSLEIESFKRTQEQKAEDDMDYEDPPKGCQFFPVRITTPEKVTKIACGDKFNAAILRSGKCVTWGLSSVGELGRNIDGAVFSPSPMEVSWEDEDDLTKSKLKRKVLDVACGGFHMLVVANDCSPDGSVVSDWCVYSCGLNQFGQLGLGSVESSLEKRNIPVLRKIPFFDKKNIAFVAAGGAHSLCLDITRQHLYSFGKATYGQLGIKLPVSNENEKHMDKMESTPKAVYLHSGSGAEKRDEPMKVNPKIRSMSCGSNHSMVITEEGDLFTWGMGSDGVLGHGTFVDSYLPTKVNDKKVKNVMQASGSTSYSMILLNGA